MDNTRGAGGKITSAASVLAWIPLVSGRDTNMSETIPKRTVTDKLVEQAFRTLGKKLDAEYEKCCPHRPAGEGWFSQLTRAEGKLAEMLAVRPLSKAEIAATIDKAFKALRKTLQVEKSKQPRYREVTNIESGEVRLIPYDE